MLKAVLRHSVLHVIRLFLYPTVGGELGKTLNSMYRTMTYVYLMIMIGECT